MALAVGRTLKRNATAARAKALNAGQGKTASTPFGKTLGELKTFAEKFGRWRVTGDQPLQNRIYFGYSSKRPGLSQLMQQLFETSGVGKIKATEFRDLAPQ